MNDIPRTRGTITLEYIDLYNILINQRFDIYERLFEYCRGMDIEFQKAIGDHVEQEWKIAAGVFSRRAD